MEKHIVEIILIIQVVQIDIYYFFRKLNKLCVALFSHKSLKRLKDHDY